MLKIGININDLKFILTESIGNAHFNIDISIVIKKHFAETINIRVPEFNYIDVEYKTISYEKQDLFTNLVELKLKAGSGFNSTNSIELLI